MKQKNIAKLNKETKVLSMVKSKKKVIKTKGAFKSEDAIVKNLPCQHECTI